MEKLESLLNVTRLSDRVVRVLGQNPGKFTLQGTNTYLIGTSNPYVLLDTGEGRPEYPPLLRTALASVSNHTLPDVSDIILTHRHHDHVRGLPSVLTLLRELWDARNPGAPFSPPRIHKFPISTDTALDELAASLPDGSYAPSAGGGAFHPLEDGQEFTPREGEGRVEQALRIVHTPGHTTDSIALLYPADRALFTGDTVLGQGTAVFEDLASYLSSLSTLVALSSEGDGYGILYPAHGPVVQDGAKTIATYRAHRLEREAQIVGVLRGAPPEGAGAWSTWGIVSTLYAQYPTSLWEPAAHGVTLHLRKLQGEGRVAAQGGEGKDARWVLT
ncbi:Metallo-hydrolase/oxidoreductase [Auriscalpium vulgare]|uniref:Metallo-hydrolase/oxidoreductase n=1 Tax=Auriscalpium vulgare TaxID=40419 RepID=A0ACB8RTA2_9AGAM|nr:Metallo-hydrolase/oxidoreductase [Auriscalpium vulgare]